MSVSKNILTEEDKYCAILLSQLPLGILQQEQTQRDNNSHIVSDNWATDDVLFTCTNEALSYAITNYDMLQVINGEDFLASWQDVLKSLPE